MHHGLQVEIEPIDEPNLTAFHIQVSTDDGATWRDYDDGIQPVDGNRINLPYRGRFFAFQTETDYQIRLCAVYGAAHRCSPDDPSQWSDPADVRLARVTGFDTDTDQDFLAEYREYNLGLDPLNPDSDGDDAADHVEVANGEDPTVAQLPLLEVSVDRLDFGEGNPWGDQTNQHQEIVVRNRGERKMRIFNLIIDDNPPASFQVDNRVHWMHELPVGGDLRIPVDFLPNKLGSAAGSLFILTDDRRNFPKEIPLSGIGKGIANLKIVGTPSLGFGNLAVGEESGRQSVTLSNPESDTPLNVGAFVTEALGFVVYPQQLTIPPNESREIRVSFAPDWFGEFAGYLRIQGGRDIERKVLRLPLTGFGDGDQPSIRVVRRHVNFGAAIRCSEKKEQIRIYNAGEGLLYVRWIDQGHEEGIVDLCPAVGSISPFRVSSRSFTVPPRGSRPIEVTFQPPEVGSYASQLCILSNDPAVDGSEGDCDVLRSTSTGDPLAGGTIRVMLYGRGE